MTEEEFATVLVERMGLDEVCSIARHALTEYFEQNPDDFKEQLAEELEN